MAKKSQQKRPAAFSSQRPSKKRKVTSTSDGKKNTTKKVKGKDKAYDRPVIPIPEREEDDNSDLSEEDLEFFKEHLGAGRFLQNLDKAEISRSKKETERLFQLSKPARVRAPVDDDLPSVESHDEDEGSWNSDIEEGEDSSQALSEDNEDDASIPSSSRSEPSDSDSEKSYERMPRGPNKSWDDKEAGPERLPIKLPDGRIQKMGKLPSRPQEEDTDTESSSDEEEEPERIQPAATEDVATGARFGRAAVVDVVKTKSRKERIQAAKEQLAGLCQEIIADPENSLGLLRRLHTFSLKSITTPSHPKPVPNDPLIRQLAFLSQLAVFKDVIPGYRIRPLTDKEKAVKVSQMVMRTREWEQGLVGVYQSYLKTLESEIKGLGELTTIAYKCLCSLLTSVTHFNFRLNIMSTIVARLSKRSWDETSELCLSSLITVLREDITGVSSLEVVRLLNRMVKERCFNVHPNLLSCLLHLRLKTELGVRSSETRADREDQGKDKGKKGDKKSKKDRIHLSKKAKKALKERKEIEQEMHEAEAEVDKEERAKTHTETLKLLFVLYFKILKHPKPTALLPPALEGIARFAHLVNIDFFRDLLRVLKELMLRGKVEDNPEAPEANAVTEDQEILRQRLLCIVAAFELLSGQGEALNIDLGEFINHLYAIIPELAVSPSIEDAPQPPVQKSVQSDRPSRRGTALASPSDLLFRALSIASMSRAFSSTTPWRSAAFAKRLLTSSLSWPPATALRAIEFVRTLLVSEPMLDAILSTQDRRTDGVYRPDIDDPQLCNPFATTLWELQLLEKQHWDPKVREEARKLARFDADRT
ncbi:hypothetical protein BOTBODRAFT_63430 [Botryobasidium botryosum FD-172 SS1]|uniref:Nucleolar complex-associated protein 3 n=1 Tax=Botryobasidium botryosum (strain FD-172 SS1) TaxID=930990 RepID=A0A067MSC9_BOTB1|nr:hypothetical protein BOTBODRAFT_63430 [Botryobasidium botryosum FD-172 SS1]